MTKRTARALALVLSATPLLLIGCGDNGNNNGTGGSSGGGFGGAIKYNGGGGGAGGAEVDAGVPARIQRPPPPPRLAPRVRERPTPPPPRSPRAWLRGPQLWLFPRPCRSSSTRPRSI